MHKPINNFDVILYGGYGLGNFGDDILMMAFVNWIKRISPRTSIGLIIVLNDMDYVNSMFPGVTTVERGSPLLLTSELFIFGGGTQWYSFPNTNLRTSKIREILSQFGYRFKPSGICEKYNARTKLALGVGVGPFLAGNEKKSMNDLKDFQYIGVRDPESYRLCKKHHIDHTFLRADICYDDRYWNLSGMRKSAGRSKKIGLIPRDWPHTTEGFQFLIPLNEVAAEYRKKGFQVEYLVFSKLREISTMKFLDEKGEKYAVWDPKNNPDVDHFLSLIADCDLVISARYHGTVAAAILGIPSIAIEVEQKLSLASQTLSPGCQLWKQPFNKTELVNLIDDFFGNYEQRVAAIKEKLIIQKKLANVMLCEVAHYF